MGEVFKEIREWWPVIAFVLTLIGWIGQLTFTYFKKQHERVAIVEQEHQSHEELCSQRYAAIERQFETVKERSDERHEETKERLDAIVGGMDDIRSFLMNRGGNIQ